MYVFWLLFVSQKFPPQTEGPSTGTSRTTKVLLFCHSSLSFDISETPFFFHFSFNHYSHPCSSCDVNHLSLNFMFITLFISSTFCFSSSICFVQSSHETLNIVEKKQAEVGIEETIMADDINRGKMQVVSDEEPQKMAQLSKKGSSSLSSDSSSSENEDDIVEYQPLLQITQSAIKEEQEENENIMEEEHKAPAVEYVETSGDVNQVKETVKCTEVMEALVQTNEVPTKMTGEKNLMKLAKSDSKEERDEEQQLKLNGETSHTDIDVSPQIICCSEVNGRRRTLRDFILELNLSAFLLCLLQVHKDSDLEGKKILSSVMSSELLLLFVCLVH